MTNEVQHFFMCLLPICIWFGVVSFKFSAHISLFLYLSLLSSNRVLYILDTSDSSNICLGQKYLFSDYPLHFGFLNNTFGMEKFWLILIYWWILIYHFFMLYAFWDLSHKNFFYTQMANILSHILFLFN